MKKLATWVLVLGLFAVTSNPAQAQTTSSMTGVRRSIATVMFAGLAGAVLGLSTLSFYGDPQEHIGNIWTGLAVGALAGGGYVISQNTRTNSTSTMNTTMITTPPPPRMMAHMSRPLFIYSTDF